MVSFHRVTAAGDEAFAPGWALYTTSFPQHEQRTEDKQARLLANPQYHFDVITADGAFAGILLYWQLSGYTYIEHFAIDPNRRGQSLGSRSLASFCKRHPLVVLEIDPPVDAISLRREGFYHRLGFVSSPHAHTHPAYRAQLAPHSLVILSHPRPLTTGEVELFQRELQQQVMADAAGYRTKENT